MAFSASVFFFFFFLILLSINPSSAQSYNNISLGTTFSPTSNRFKLSLSGDFAFGFRPIDPSSNSSLFLLAVWFNKLPDKTVVWAANRDAPVSNQSQAQLTTDGRLSLQEANGTETWSAGVNTASYGAILDTGNFMLVNRGTGMVWQTFDSPTDTILPGQTLSPGAQVYSSLMAGDYSQGRFELTLQQDGNLVLYPLAYPTTMRYRAYWELGTSGTGVRLVFNGNGSIVYVNSSATVPVLSAAITGDEYLRATLDPDGVFRIYSSPKKGNLSTGSWTSSTNSTPPNICTSSFDGGSGACGFNSFCIRDANGMTDCQCPPYYSYIDPARKFRGCKPDFVAQSCDNPGDQASFSLVQRTNVDWPFADAESYSPMNDTACQENCLRDCFCLVAIYNANMNGGSCWKKKFPLSNGRSDANVDRVAYIKYSTLNSSTVVVGPSSVDRRTDWKPWVVVITAIFGGSVLLNVVQIGACCFLYRRAQRQLPEKSGKITGGALCSFTYKELEEATNKFSEEIGKGAFGTVYKGVLQSQPKTLIAVKKLEETDLQEEAEKDFANEVATIGQTHHKNLVRLLGFCKEGLHRMMVFEYMSNGSLNKFLFGNERPKWNRRVQIVLGIASGLAYLHEECRTQIIHCDIKPQNILLDDNLEARISDFGLAKLLKLDQTRTSTGIRGTIGYFAPEWFKNVAITAKVDVYSFGVMLLEIVCCRKNFEWGLESQERATVIDWAKECYRNGRLDLLVEEDEEAKRDGIRLERLVLVGISCVQDEPWLRPSMKKVVQMLEGAIAASVPPNMYSVRS